MDFSKFKSFNKPEENDNEQDFVDMSNDSTDDSVLDLGEEEKPVEVKKFSSRRERIREERREKKLAEIEDIDEDEDIELNEIFKTLSGNTSEVVDLNTTEGEMAASRKEFTIVQDNSSFSFIKFSKKMFGFLFAFVSLAVIVISVIILSFFNVVAKNVDGADYKLGNISLISKSYQVNVSNINPGDSVVLEKNSLFGKTLMLGGFDVVEISSIEGPIVKGVNQDGDDVKFVTPDIDYKVSVNK